MSTKKSTFDHRPSLVEIEGKTILVCFDIEERTEEITKAEDKEGETETKTVYDCYAVRIAQPISKDKIVDAIVSTLYPSDKMQAIVNNHLLDSEDDEDYEDHEAEYKEMQTFRKEAKKTAKEVVEKYLEDMQGGR